MKKYLLFYILAFICIILMVSCKRSQEKKIKIPVKKAILTKLLKKLKT